MSWRSKLNINRRTGATRVSRNGQVVLAAPARRAAGIGPGDLVVSVPVAPGVLLLEKVHPATQSGVGAAANPLDGAWGDHPDSWLDDLRSGWRADRS